MKIQEGHARYVQPKVNYEVQEVQGMRRNRYLLIIFILLIVLLNLTIIIDIYELIGCSFTFRSW